MKTEDLIAALAADTRPGRSVAQHMARALPPALGVTVAAFVLFWGLRPDLAAALASGAALKTVVPLALAGLAGALALALARPGAAVVRPALALALCGGGLGLGLAVALVQGGGAGLVWAVATPSLWTCLASVPALALPVLGAALWALRSGAALRPGVTGGAAGLLAGGIGAAVYSLYCDQDGALFVLVAYGAAISAVVLIGAALGARALRW
jgi:hypothetical protein